MAINEQGQGQGDKASQPEIIERASRVLGEAKAFGRAISETGEPSSYNPVARGQPGTHDRLGVVLRPEREVAHRHGVTQLP